ncbi:MULTISPECIES: ROK family protein [Streptomyces]|uniref:Glucokinase n=1 Tax=Streptomyces clavifer TaxID=68188 RepID=A0ABS4VGE6_9ACTN|nr:MULTISPECIES: ROK family protein [Streptomyces]KQX94676.1 ROK family transcriptional regulator [Streptomyces sp. Root1319]KQZ05363.1 ROK family transcriptional regulator [Streptomyces sp. Root55]MBP2362984.1 glucokinase [Streptomyces clavifer]MDX2742955.1 ROK family protein [Streptomyces sp. NRRL_B-2557]RPK72838.1 N-acetylmannosamine kinase [Streptomyces sp. ADI97-07]
MHTDLVAALDIGGTKIAGALVDGDGSLLVRAQRPTPAREDAESVMGAVAAVLEELKVSPLWHGARAVGIGSAGPVDASAGTVSPVNVPGWRDFPLVERVVAETGGLPVALVGDGVAMTAAEHWLGAARGYDNALCLVVSTGVGGGLVLGGKLHRGPTGNAGHIGHISVDLDGDLCPCGARGCVERLASGPNIARRALENGWLPGPDGDATAAAVAASARLGDRAAVASFERAAQALAAGIAATATLTEIDIAVIGGGVAGAGEVLFAPLRRSLRDYATLSFVRGLTVAPAVMGTDAGLVGAAAAASSVRHEGANARAVAAP